MKGATWCALSAAAVGFFVVVGFEMPDADAAILDLTSQNPDLFAGSLTIDYVASGGSTGSLSVTGFPTSFNISGTSTPDYPVIGGNDAYSITALLNKATGQPISGSLSITGIISGLASSGTLLTGQLTQFGFPPPPGGDVFEFVFKVTGGDLAPYYNGQVGVEATALTGSGFDGSFGDSFNSPASQTVSDNFPVGSVPEPTSVIVWAGFGLLASGFGRFRRTK